MLKQLVVLANRLDEAGYTTLADALDGLVVEAQIAPEMATEEAPASDVGIRPSTQPSTDEFRFNPATRGRAEKLREKVLYDGIMTKLVGVPTSTLHYYEDIMGDIRQLKTAVDRAEKMQEGSAAQVQLVRKINDAYNNIFDPYNVSLPISQIKFINEIGTISDLVKKYLPQFNKPEFSDDQIIENFSNQLKEKGFLADLNKLKRSK